MIFFLHPYHKNLSKRIVKTAKVYFYDTGLVCNLLGIQSENQLNNHWARGAIFENMIIADVLKNYFNAGQRPPVYFWRDNKGLEIDLLIDDPAMMKAIEIKSGTTLKPDLIVHLEKFQKLSTEPLSKHLIYGGDTHATLKDTQVIPWRNFSGSLR